VKSTVMRWGNYDVLNAAVTWNVTEGQPGAATYLPANVIANPSNHTLPVSFYQSGRPAWWTVVSGVQPPWPGIGPDVTGGPGPGGYAYNIPAANCYYNILRGPVDGSGSPLAFDAAKCYSAGTSSAPVPPTLLTAVTQ
jgi:hypothetical protein